MVWSPRISLVVDKETQMVGAHRRRAKIGAEVESWAFLATAKLLNREVGTVILRLLLVML